MKCRSVLVWVGIALGVIGLSLVVSVVAAAIVHLSWNSVMPDLFGLPHIAFWQAWALTWLAWMLSGVVGFNKKR